MSIKLDCPVCGYKEIEGQACPNCDADLSTIRLLMELPSIPNAIAEPDKGSKNILTTLMIAIAMLMMGILLGAIGNYLFVKPQIITQNIVIPTPSINKVTPNSIKKPKLTQIQQYIVKDGDSLSQIAEKLCGTGTRWQIMVENNFQLIGREGELEVGEILKVPKCEEGKVNAG